GCLYVPARSPAPPTLRLVELKQLGSLRVSRVGLGANNFGGRTDEERSRSVIDAALDAGINFIDTAEVYSNGESERIIGTVLKRRRNDVVIATKFRPPGDETRIREAVEASLKRLQT